MKEVAPYIGAIVRQENGSPARVETYFQSENLNQGYADLLNLPKLDRRTGFDIVYYFQKTADGQLAHRRMHFLAYNRQGKLVEVNARSAHDVIVLATDPVAEANGTPEDQENLGTRVIRFGLERML